MQIGYGCYRTSRVDKQGPKDLSEDPEIGLSFGLKTVCKSYMIRRCGQRTFNLIWRLSQFTPRPTSYQLTLDTDSAAVVETETSVMRKPT